jgi:nitroimidazol reductase NimA-like FMN-containing flavoprotein (pyridoxamine 5'-phosphate oxidase superfamily)
MLGKLKENQIEDLLKYQVVGRLGCHSDGMTYIVPISYAYDGEYIYGRTTEGMKTSMMRKNPNVCFEVDEMKDMANWKSVIAWGEFEELENEEQRNKALKILMDRELPLVSSETTHLSSHWPFPEKDISTISGVVYRIRLTEKTGRFENNGSSFSFTS